MVRQTDKIQKLGNRRKEYWGKGKKRTAEYVKGRMGMDGRTGEKANKNQILKCK